LEAGVWKKNSLAFKMLFYLEKKQARKADVLIACVASMKDYIKEKYKTSPKEFYWKPVAVDFDLFSEKKKKNTALLKELDLQNKCIAVYAGKFGGSYLKKEVFALIKAAYNKWENDFRFLLLSNHPKTEVQEWMQEYQIPEAVLIQKYVPHSRVPDYIGLADFAVVPFVPVPSKRYGSPIKTAEYMAMGLPIIITKDISDDSKIIKANHFGYELDDYSEKEIKQSINTIEKMLLEKEELARATIVYARKHKNINKAITIYNSIYL
jgi:glycosyltransferase involved in cell wall biosynthesis